jgi:hypothetical protein
MMRKVLNRMLRNITRVNSTEVLLIHLQETPIGADSFHLVQITCCAGEIGFIISFNVHKLIGSVGYKK